MHKGIFPFWLLVYIFILMALGSRYVVQAFDASIIYSRVVTVLVYLPFITFTVVFIVALVRKKIPFSRNAKLLVVFIFYAAALQLYRYISGAVDNECTYYTLTLIGSISFMLLETNGFWTISKRKLTNSLLGFAAFVLLFINAYEFFFTGIVVSSPVDRNIITTLILMLLPVLCFSREEKGVIVAIRIILIICSICYILLCESRAAFALLFFVLAGMVIVNWQSRKTVIMIIATTLASIAIVAIFCIADVGDSRYALERELDGFGISITGLFEDQTEEDLSKSEIEEETSGSSEQAASSQIERSDNMREDLFNYGIEQINANPLFGTGRLTIGYYLPMAGDTFRSAPHNFIIETMVCYGLAGSILLVVLFCSVIMSLIKSTNRITGWRRYVGSACLTSVVFFTIGFVQPIVYQPVALMLFVLTLLLFLRNDSIEAERDLIALTGRNDATL